MACGPKRDLMRAHMTPALWFKLAVCITQTQPNAISPLEVSVKSSFEDIVRDTLSTVRRSVDPISAEKFVHNILFEHMNIPRDCREWHDLPAAPGNWLAAPLSIHNSCAERPP